MYVVAIAGEFLSLFIGAAHNGISPLQEKLYCPVVIKYRPANITANPLGKAAK
jgi:hypothetical protein|tara:strand:+ start:84 stop:242 length:159 start_codon:yes stop_codon:yes gene_type:complete